MKIEVHILAEEDMRYTRELNAFTLGDYYHRAGALHFEVCDTGSDLFNKLILIHELVEQTLIEVKGLKEKDIDDWDVMFERLLNEGKVPEDAEPGAYPGCPYWHEHMFADLVERMMLNHLGMNYDQYNQHILNLNNANDTGHTEGTDSKA